MHDIAAAQSVTFGNEAPGTTPKDFEYGVAGDGGPARWEIVADAEAAGGRALAQLSANTASYRFPVAIYNPVTARNVEITTRCKPVAGREDRACGVIVRATDARNYYVARANALEDNVRFYRVRDGKRQQLATADNVKVASGQWHTLTLRVEGDRYTVVFDGVPMHATADTTDLPRPAAGGGGTLDEVRQRDLFRPHRYQDAAVNPRSYCRRDRRAKDSSTSARLWLMCWPVRE
jgi:hypothetical protein